MDVNMYKRIFTREIVPLCKRQIYAYINLQQTVRGIKCEEEEPEIEDEQQEQDTKRQVQETKEERVGSFFTLS